MALFTSKNKIGFSLVETTVVMGVMSAITLATAQIMVYQSKENQKIVYDSMAAAVASEIRLALTDKNNCLNSIGGVNPTGAGANIPNIVENGVATYTAGSSYGYGKHSVFVEEIEVHNFQSTSDTGGGKKRGFCLISVTLDDDDDNTNNSDDSKRRVFKSALTVTLNGANQVDGCTLSTSDSDLLAACDSLGGTLVVNKCVNLHTGGTLNVNTQVLANRNINTNGLTISGGGTASTSVTGAAATDLSITGGAVTNVPLINTGVIGSGTVIYTSDNTYNMPVTQVNVTDGRVCSYSSGSPKCGRAGYPVLQSVSGLACPAGKAILRINGDGDIAQCGP